MSPGSRSLTLRGLSPRVDSYSLVVLRAGRVLLNRTMALITGELQEEEAGAHLVLKRIFHICGLLSEAEEISFIHKQQFRKPLMKYL